VLLDTTILVDVLRGGEAALRWLDAMEKRATLSVVSLTEVYAGARNRREERQIAELEALFRWLPVTIDIARRAGVFLRLFEKGHGIDDADALIAATAEHHGLDLATLNVKHFPMFPRLQQPY
jgi:predicted nucleic acid-binding protein